VRIVAIVLLIAAVTQAQQPKPLSLPEACSAYAPAVVRIEAGGQSRGSGFIVSEDGYVLTAAHVVIDKNSGAYFSTILVKLPVGGNEFAHIVTPLTHANIGQDYALLKVDTKMKLPSLKLGGIEEAIVGSDAIIVGFPFSAVTLEGFNVGTKFCLSAIVAATDLVSIPVSLNQKHGVNVNTISKTVSVDVVYFQGPAVQGLSGSPIISRSSGHVVGVVTTKLAGLSRLFDRAKQGLANPGMEFGNGRGGVIGNINELINGLETQLSNNLGGATGIDDPKHALAQAQRQQQKQRK
jgi:S1-C subfamily serine protease